MRLTERQRSNEAGMKARKLFLLLCCLLMAGCSSTLRYYPYSFNAEPARKVAKVVLAPMNLMSPVPNQIENRGAPVREAIAAYLADHGLRVEAGDAMQGVWEQEKQKAGGIYSPADGALDKAKFNAALRSAISKVCRIHAADAVVLPEVILRKATLEHSSFMWDGTWQPIERDGGYVDPFLETFTGSINALSLRILIVDRDGRLILMNVAGMEPLYKVSEAGRGAKWILRKNMLTDTAKIGHAVATSLHPFIAHGSYPPNPRFSKE